MEVYISANAFWALLISAIEVYKKECFGLLLGYRDNSNAYIVEHAVSYQTAKRQHTSVEKNRRASRRMNKFLENLPQAIDIALTGDTIEDAFKNKLELSVPKAKYTAYGFGTLEGLLGAAVTFQAELDPALGYSFQAVLTNAVTGY